MSAANPSPRLPITSKYRGPCFRAVETVLREDPVLAEVVKTWISLEGSDVDLQPPAYDECPMISLSPEPVSNYPFGVSADKINFQVDIDIILPGTCIEDAFAMWEAVEDAIVDSRTFRGGTVRSFLCHIFDAEGPKGVMNLRANLPAFSQFRLPHRQGDEDRQPAMQRGRGSLVCFFSRPK